MLCSDLETSECGGEGERGVEFTAEEEKFSSEGDVKGGETLLEEALLVPMLFVGSGGCGGFGMGGSEVVDRLLSNGRRKDFGGGRARSSSRLGS